jgi:two-component sensor histidine kinase
MNCLAEQHARIAALGLVHGELMSQPDAVTIDVTPLLRDLAGTIQSGVGDRSLAAHVDTDQLQFPIDQTVPLCLLTAELLIGCAARVPPSGTKPIVMSLRRMSDAAMALTLTAADAGDATSLLAELETRPVRDLVSQLGAALEVSTPDGLLVQATFHG